MGFLPGADYLCLSVDVDVAVCHAVVNPPSADCGAALLGLIIIKLMLVDSARGGLSKAISFIGVAILVSIVGYFSPLPPKTERSKESNVESERGNV